MKPISKKIGEYEVKINSDAEGDADIYYKDYAMTLNGLMLYGELTGGSADDDNPIHYVPLEYRTKILRWVGEQTGVDYLA